MEILCLILGKSFTVSLIDAIVCKNEASHEEAAVVIYVMALYDERTQSINTGCLFLTGTPLNVSCVSRNINVVTSLGVPVKKLPYEQ